MADKLSAHLEKFLRERLTTIDQCEIVMLLRGDRSRSWTAIDVASALSMPAESSAMRLFLLASGGLIAFEPASIPRYRYAGDDAETEALLEELAALLEHHREAVTSILEGPPPDPLRSFSDAFRLKR